MGSNKDTLFHINFEEDKTREGNIDDLNEYLLESEGFKLFQMNVSSINKKYDELKILFASLSTNLDCIVLSECHIGKDIHVEQFYFQGYKIYYTKNHTRKTDGVIVYIRETLEQSVEEIFLQDCNGLKITVKKK